MLRTQGMVSAFFFFCLKNLITYTEIIVIPAVMGFRKKRLLSGYIDQGGLTKEESFHIPL